MSADPWLERWLPLIAERCSEGFVLELGCGRGEDTATLARAGHSVVALDLSPERVAEAQARVPSARLICQDIRSPFPLGGRPAGAVVASLSLHYFSWAETCRIVGRIRESLAANGILLCRLNSVRDVHFGATGHSRISENFYMVNGVSKRFFDQEAVSRLFSDGWRFLSLEEQVCHRYGSPKILWEAILERTPASPVHNESAQVSG